jgi:hypothetical protein
MPTPRTCAPASPPGVCPDCGGPSLLYRGSIHRWRCTACLNAVLGLDRPPPPYRPDWDYRLGAPSASSADVIYATSTAVASTTTREDPTP